MEPTCPRCKATVPEGSVFCSQCGMPLRADAPIVTRVTTAQDTDFVPIPGAQNPPDMRVRKRRRRRTPWYRKKRFLVPLVMVAILLTTLAAGAWYIKTRFDTLNELSTPPAEISGDRLGGDEEVVIDTGPAQDALKEAEDRRERARREAAEATEVAENAPPGQAATEPAAQEPVVVVTRVAGRGDGGEDAAPGAAGGEEIPSNAMVVEVNDAGTPVLVREPAATPGAALAMVPDPVEKDSYAFLMMGVDARPGEAIDVGVRPDSLFVVYLDGSDGSCRVLSIPRDTRTNLPGYGQSKINHALAVGGVPYETLVVENLLGIELQHYGLIDFAGVEGLVDGVGGVTVVNDEAFSAGGHEFPVGRLELNGDDALAYSRYRGGADGDFGRQERQQDVVRAILTQGADMDVVTEIPRLLDSVDSHVRTDLGPDDMVDIAQDFRSTCNGDTLETSRVEGVVAWAYDDLMQMELSFVLVDQAELDRKVAWLLTGDETPAPEERPAATPGATPGATPDATPAAIRDDVSADG
jgi:LCP family protein required for cell wall assembly